MLKFTHFEGLDNLWKQLFILVPHSALYSGTHIWDWGGGVALVFLRGFKLGRKYKSRIAVAPHVVVRNTFNSQNLLGPSEVQFKLYLSMMREYTASTVLGLFDSRWYLFIPAGETMTSAVSRLKLEYFTNIHISIRLKDTLIFDQTDLHNLDWFWK